MGLLAPLLTHLIWSKASWSSSHMFWSPPAIKYNWTQNVILSNTGTLPKALSYVYTCNTRNFASFLYCLRPFPSIPQGISISHMWHLLLKQWLSWLSVLLLSLSSSSSLCCFLLHLMLSTICDQLLFWCTNAFQSLCVTLSLASSPTNVHYTVPSLHHNISLYFADFIYYILSYDSALLLVLWFTGFELNFFIKMYTILIIVIVIIVIIITIMIVLIVIPFRFQISFI